MASRAKKKTAKKKATKKKVVKRMPKNTTERRGRPTKYKPEYCDVVIEKMAEGYSKEAVAGFLEISKDTLYQWAKAHPDFSDAIAIGESKSRVFWEKKLVEYAVHTKNGKQINAQVFNLNMKNRFGWRDKNEVSVGEETAKTFGFKLDVNPDEVGE